MINQKLYEELEDGLAIDEDDIDRCLVEHPDFFFNVAKEHTLAVAVKDEAKLIFDQASAEIDEQLRLQASKSEERVTEGALKSRLAGSPKIRHLNKDYLSAKKDADMWGALERSYEQKTKMLERLVQWKLGQLHHLHIEGGVRSARTDIGDSNRLRAGQIRRQRREGKE
jgi:hypothetical protein